ncbi:hypothetical protein CK203_108933 [Vitis vinifera]|uniref:Uncharacterized protein n=1 Tax=Vitis vinifera TaxID=29760 RepID=A0A438CH23_VITVI|nr:hypothetical protein CK203_108933 [Vitis vinifera]
MRKIWPSEDNCIKLRDNFARWKARCEFLSPKYGNFAHLKPKRPLWSGWTTSTFDRTSRLSFYVRFSSTLVFCYQLHLFLLCPQSLLLQLMILNPVDDATPVAVPSIVAAEDPSYPPEEPTT